MVLIGKLEGGTLVEHIPSFQSEDLCMLAGQRVKDMLRPNDNQMWIYTCIQAGN